MNLVIACVGLLSFASIFVGTAIGILAVGFDFGAKVFVASLLIFLFCVVIDKISRSADGTEQLDKIEKDF